MSSLLQRLFPRPAVFQRGSRLSGLFRKQPQRQIRRSQEIRKLRSLRPEALRGFLRFSGQLLSRKSSGKFRGEFPRQKR